MYDALMNPSPCSGSVDLAVNKQNTLGKTYFKKVVQNGDMAYKTEPKKSVQQWSNNVC